MAAKRGNDADIYDLDDIAYREYSRTQLARARKRGDSGTGRYFDVLVFFVLMLATISVLLFHLGKIRAF